MSGKTRILIVDDHTIVRIGLTALLGAETDFEVVGEAKNGLEAVKSAKSLHPDVIVMDLVMPKKNGIDATAEILEALPTTKVLVLTSFGTSDGIAHALQVGAVGAVMKTADDGALVSAIRKVMRGERVISPEIKRMLNEDPPVPELSTRQREILAAITSGRSNKEIASDLGIRKDSVEDYLRTLFSKLGAANRTEAVAIALRKHLLKGQNYQFPLWLDT